MCKKSDEFFKRMLYFLPSTETEYIKSIQYHKGVLETVIIEDVFMHEIIKILEEDKETKLLKRMFDYFEEVSNCEDPHLLNIFSITVLEILGNDPKILKIARKYMGSKTIKLQIEADANLGRTFEGDVS